MQHPARVQGCTGKAIQQFAARNAHQQDIAGRHREFERLRSVIKHQIARTQPGHLPALAHLGLALEQITQPQLVAGMQAQVGCVAHPAVAGRRHGTDLQQSQGPHGQRGPEAAGTCTIPLRAVAVGRDAVAADHLVPVVETMAWLLRMGRVFELHGSAQYPQAAAGWHPGVYPKARGAATAALPGTAQLWPGARFSRCVRWSALSDR